MGIYALVCQCREGRGFASGASQRPAIISSPLPPLPSYIPKINDTMPRKQPPNQYCLVFSSCSCLIAYEGVGGHERISMHLSIVS